MKKFRLLSTMLALVMVLSMVSVMPAGASQTGVEPFFCNFESFPLADGTTTTSAAATFTDAGFTEITGVANAVIDTDATYGRTLGQIKNNNFSLKKELDTAVTSGKVRVGFSYKLSAGGFGYVYSLGSSKSTAVMNLSSAGAVLMGPTNGKVLISSTTAANIGKWFYIEIIIDPANNTWTVYVDGVLAGSHTGTGLVDFKGIQFYNNANTRANTDARIDNLVISYETGSETTARILDTKLVDNDDETKSVKLVFSEAIGAFTANDVTIEKCGDSNLAIDVTSVELNANNAILNLASDASFDEGCEYVVKFADNVKALSGKDIDETYVYLSMDDNVTTYTELKAFEDLVEGEETYTPTGGSLTKKTVVTNPYAKDILRRADYYTNPDGTTYIANTVKTTVDSANVGTTSASGNALGAAVWTKIRLLDIIPTDVGVESYEFDFMVANNYSIDLSHTTVNTTTGTNIKVTNTISTSGKWKHMKIDYDTVNDTISVYIDGELHKKTTGITQFDHPLFYTNNAATSTFQIDNYTSYTTVTHLSVESVRYTDATGKVTGANSISPETEEIAITFSEAINAATVGGITLTANGEAIEIDENAVTVDSATVTLPVAGLPGNAEIELTIPTTVKSSAGSALTENRVYKVYVPGGEPEISDLALSVGGAEITAPGTINSGTDITVTANVTYGEDFGSTIAVIYAFYADDELVAVDVANVSVDKTTSTISKTFTVDKDVTYTEVKAFIWDALRTRTPLTVAASYPAN